MVKLTDKQKRFAEEYLIDCNAVAAAVRAGYSKKGAVKSAWQLLEHKGIKELITEKMAELESAKIADTKEVLEYLTQVLRGESESSVLVSMGGSQGVANKPPDEKERLKAAELLGKRLGIFTEQVNLNAVSVIIKDDLD